MYITDNNKKLLKKIYVFFRTGENKYIFDTVFKNYPQGIPILLDNFRYLFFGALKQYVPFNLLWRVTYKCNCNCNFCVQQGYKKKDLNSKEVFRLASQISRSKICVVILSGGEPFVRSDLFNILEILRKRNKCVVIATNGVLIKEFRDDILSLGVEQLMISIDSHLPTIHDHLRNTAGAFDRIMKGIESIKEKRKGKRPFINVRAVVSKENIDHLGDYLDFFKPRVDSISFSPLQLYSANYTNNNRDQLLDKSDAGKLRKIITEYSKKYYFLKTSYYRLMPDFVENPKKLISNNLFRCLLASAFYLEIQNNGDVSPCSQLSMSEQGSKIKGSLSLGNIKYDELEGLWKIRKCFLIQNFLRSKKNKCICWCSGNDMNTDLARFFK